MQKPTVPMKLQFPLMKKRYARQLKRLLHRPKPKPTRAMTMATKPMTVKVTVTVTVTVKVPVTRMVTVKVPVTRKAKVLEPLKKVKEVSERKTKSVTIKPLVPAALRTSAALNLSQWHLVMTFQKR